jgi:hypothetical protein
LPKVANALLAGAVGLSLVAHDAAWAATCYSLRAELAHLQGQGAGGAGSRARYERAFREQANVLARTERRARNAGCFNRGFLFFRRQRAPECDTLMPKLRQMQENLAVLDRQRRRSGGGNNRRIRQLQAAIAQQCGERDQFLDARRPQSIDQFSSYGTFRTLCVRTCDGYYFPISYATSYRQFYDDARACAAMCPGTEAKLYVYPNPGGTPEDAVGIEGGRYADLATAFQYRTSLDASCTCKGAGNMSVAAVGERPALAPVPADDGTAPPPNPRPAPGEDPETLANRAGHFVPGATTTAPPGAVADATSADGRPIRVVGPPQWGAKDQDSVILTPVPN